MFILRIVKNVYLKNKMLFLDLINKRTKIFLKIKFFNTSVTSTPNAAEDKINHKKGYILMFFINLH